MKTFAEQVAEHLAFLRTAGLEVVELIIDPPIPIRCRALGETMGRGECAYRTQRRSMQKPGIVGLSTWCRGPGGTRTFKTYGSDGDYSPPPSINVPLLRQSPEHPKEHEKARFVWEQASLTGRSLYLERKGVGSHGLRYLQNSYGCVAVVPLRDSSETIQGLQFLNPDGSKRFLKGSNCVGTFHKLAEPMNGRLIGISESYTTSATCFELSHIPIVCAFSSENLSAVTKTILEKYPKSPIVLFADNDRHLEQSGKPNQGVLKGRQAQTLNETRIILAVPDFGDCEPSKEASDFNDLARIRGREEATEQIRKFLKC